jgi:hypothetical protein
MREKKERKTIGKNYCFKEESEDRIIKMHYVGHFYCVNGNKLMDVKCSQLMKCILCYVSSVSMTNAKT